MNNDERLTVISLGWGTQSFALAAMSAKGVLPKVDFCIHSNTTHEKSGTYDFAKRWTPWLEDHGIPVVTVSPVRCTDESGTVDKWGGIFIPAYTDSENGGDLHSEFYRIQKEGSSPETQPSEEPLP